MLVKLLSWDMFPREEDFNASKLLSTFHSRNVLFWTCGTGGGAKMLLRCVLLY